MRPVKTLLKYLLFFGLTYAALYMLFSTDGVRRASTHFLQKTGVGVTKSLLSKAYIVAQPEFKESRSIIHVGLGNKQKIREIMEGARQTGKGNVNVNMAQTEFFTEYFTLPFIFMLALILITPLSWKDKALAIVFGASLFLLFSIFKIFLAIRYNIAIANIGVYELSPFWANFLKRFIGIMQIGFSMLVGVLIWLLVAFRKSKWRKLLANLNVLLGKESKN